MKTLTAMITGLVLVSTSLTSLAARDDSRHLGLCKAEIEMALGDDVRSRLVGIKRRKGPDAMRILVVPAAGERLVVNCLVEDDAVRFQDRNGVALHLAEPRPHSERSMLQPPPGRLFWVRHYPCCSSSSRNSAAAMGLATR